MYPNIKRIDFVHTRIGMFCTVDLFLEIPARRGRWKNNSLFLLLLSESQSKMTVPKTPTSMRVSTKLFLYKP
jgi:hypothetical protein